MSRCPARKRSRRLLHEWWRPDLIPVGRFGSVEETADVAVMLARNGYVTSQTINVNGGWYMS